MIEKDGAVALLVGVGRDNGEALIKSGVLKTNGVPMIGSRAGASSLYGPDSQMIFHLWASYGTEMEKIARQCDTSNLRHMAVVFQDDAFGKDVMKSPEKAAAAQRIDIVVKAPYERGTAKVEGAVKSVLEATNSDSIVVIGVTTAATEFVKQYRQAGGAKQIFGMSVIDPTVMLEALGAGPVRGGSAWCRWYRTSLRR